MRRRFIIAINEEPEGSVAKMIALLKAIEPLIGWWHYLQGNWLVVDPTGKVTAEILRDRIQNEFPGVHHMVFELAPGGDWRGWGAKKMQKWLEESW